MAQLIDSNSLPSSKSEIDFFSVPATQVAVERTFWTTINPMNTVTSAGPYEFHIPPDPNFVDLNKNYIQVKLKITRADGTDLQNADVVGPINCIGKTFFKQCKLFLNSKLIYDSGDLYAYRAYLETLLNYSDSQKDTFLEVTGYESDTPSDHIDDNQNTGWERRRNWFAGSMIVELMSPIHADLMHQEKYLLNGMDLRMELHRHEEPFALVSFGANPNYKIHVQDIRWVVKKVELAKSITLALETTLLRNTVKYPVRRVQMKAIQLSAGRRDTPINSVFNGQIPRRLIIGLCDNDAFHGTYDKSPFNFKHYTAINIKVTAGGVDYPSNPIIMDYTWRSFTQPFVFLYETLGLGDADNNCGITPLEYSVGGRCLYGFDLSPDTSDGAHWELLKEGTTSIHIQFQNAIPAGGVKMVVLAEFDNMISVDRFRNVYFDYTP